MAVGPTAQALIARRRASRSRGPGERPESVPEVAPADTKAFAAAITVCLGGVVAAATLAEFAGVGR